MKTLFKNILVLAVMFGTLTSYSSETLETISIVDNVKKGNYISVSNASGKVIYSGRINYNGNLTSLFNFAKLEDGKYIIEINKDFEIEIKAIAVKNGVVTFLQNFNEKIYKPVFRNEGAKILISKLALDANEMMIELYYENELIHTEIVKGKKILNRVYQLDKTLRGNYSAIIKSNNRVFIENFRI